MAAAFDREPGPGRAAGGDVLVLWAERTGQRWAGALCRDVLRFAFSGGVPTEDAELPWQRWAGALCRDVLRFAFYGRVSTEDWQDPVTSRARQLQQAVMLTAGHGTIVAEFFDTGESRDRNLPRHRRASVACRGRFPSTIPDPAPEPAEPATGHPPGSRPRSPLPPHLASAHHPT